MKDHEVAIMNEAMRLIEVERDRQISSEGYTHAHDDEHNEGQLALLAAGYALSSREQGLGSGPLSTVIHVIGLLPYYDLIFKPKDPIRDLTRAGALILAELERRLRAQNPVSKAIAEGKLQEGQRTWAQNLLDRDPAGFQRYIGDAERPLSLPRWQSHKVVAADKIVGDQTDLAGYPAAGSCWLLACGVIIENPPVSRVPEGVNPVGGFFVRYEDGFESWSPAEAFGRGYDLVHE